MPKSMRVPMTYIPTGEVEFWTVWREKNQWVFRDHNGYTRVGGANWFELRDRFLRCADNHCFTHSLS